MGGYGAGDLLGAELVGILRGGDEQGSRCTASSGLLGYEDLLDGGTGRVDQEAHRAAAEHDIPDRTFVHDGEKGTNIIAGKSHSNASFRGNPCLRGDSGGRVAAGLQVRGRAQGREVTLELGGHPTNGDRRT